MTRIVAITESGTVYEFRDLGDGWRWAKLRKTVLSGITRSDEGILIEMPQIVKGMCMTIHSQPLQPGGSTLIQTSPVVSVTFE